MKNEKMGLMSCILMGIGSIIGASVFASTPIAIKIVGGHGIVIGFILAAVFVFVRSIPEMLLGSSLPATGGSYMYLSRLVHPIAGALDAFNELVVGVMKIATMALTFSTYFKYIMPSCPEEVSACLAISRCIRTISLRTPGQRDTALAAAETSPVRIRPETSSSPSSVCCAPST